MSLWIRIKKLEKRTGVDIPWIFDVEGEAGFRRRERELVKELVDQSGLVFIYWRWHYC